ncbi:unnamed protein product [Cuscuta campestris]|uniref:Uncharacterized protein n=1 Tax=Cuscuta campestris TaxID=132261 RepID=A0A484NFS1_9ASTE|nr:unnamed protein product [Cuscuta campestris]
MKARDDFVFNSIMVRDIEMTVRGNKVFKRIQVLLKERLARNQMVILFPSQGTRSRAESFMQGIGTRRRDDEAQVMRSKKHFTHLTSVRSTKGESLKELITRWRKVSRYVEGANDNSRIEMFSTSLLKGPFRVDLTTHLADFFEEAMARENRYVTLEEMNEEQEETSETSKCDASSKKKGKE